MTGKETNKVIINQINIIQIKFSIFK